MRCLFLFALLGSAWQLKQREKQYKKRQLEFVEALGDGSFMCKVCHKIFTRREHTREHYQLVHAEAEFEFVCPIIECGLRYQNRKTMHKHIKHKHDINYIKIKDLDPFMRPKSDE